MKTSAIVVPFVMLAASALAVTPVSDQRGPYIKNLMSPTYRPPVVAASHETTTREIQKLTRTAELPADHLKIANFYRAEANRLDALGAAYESAAAKYRNGPYGKNLTHPARFEFAASEFRKEAKKNHAVADSHEAMALEVAAGL